MAGVSENIPEKESTEGIDKTLPDEEKWRIESFLQQREKEREESRNRHSYLAIAVAGLFTASIVGFILNSLSKISDIEDVMRARSSEVLNEMRSRIPEIEKKAIEIAKDAAETTIRERSLADRVLIEQTAALTASFEAKALSVIAQKEAEATREEAKKLRTIMSQQDEAIQEVTKLRSSLQASGSLVEKIQSSTQEIARVALDDPIFRQAVADRVPIIPKDTVAFFVLTSCPRPGWVEYEPLRGRYAVGLPVGGSLEQLVGRALADGEDRPTGAHTHKFRDAKGEGGYPGADFGGDYGNREYTEETLSPAGSVKGTNAPYIQLLACRKI